jgi:arginyl-tRNA synthetase
MYFIFMKQKVEQLLEHALESLQSSGELPIDLVIDIKAENTKNLIHGDYASNLALLLAKPCRQSPKKIAQLLIQALPKDSLIEKIEIGGAGFINFFVQQSARWQVIAEVLKKGQEFGQGNNVAPFFYVTQKPESSDNSITNIQYAHARICSVLRQLNERGFKWDKAVGLQHLNLLEQPHETILISLICRYPEVVESSVLFNEPHQLAYYLRELANGLHSYYNAIQLLCDHEQLRHARLCLLDAVRQIINNGLNLLDVSAPESV